MTTYAEKLQARVAKGELTEITEFQGEFRWLSNFYLCPGMDHTVEHEFQAGKALYDPTLYERIMFADTPGKAKNLGRRARLPSDWDTRRLGVMKTALLRKFSHSPMREWLLATYDIPLIEGNYWHDNYWGSCSCSRCKSIPGTNMLGLLLMEVRGQLLDEEVGKYIDSQIEGKD